MQSFSNDSSIRAVISPCSDEWTGGRNVQFLEKHIRHGELEVLARVHDDVIRAAVLSERA